MLKKTILLLLFPLIAFAQTDLPFYIGSQAGLFAAFWQAPPPLAKLAPSGMPEGIVVRNYVGYYLNHYASMEIAYLWFDDATRYFDNRPYTIKQQAWDFALRGETPVLFWNISLFGSGGVDDFSASLSGLQINALEKIGVTLKANNLNLWRPFLQIGIVQHLSQRFTANMSWYHMFGQKDVASQTTFYDTVGVLQSVPDVNLFMGGITYHFNF